VLGIWFPSSNSSQESGGKSLFIAFTVCYGVFASAYISLFPTTLVETFGIQNFASVNGVLYMVRGFAMLLGTPVAGLLIRSSNYQKPDPRNYGNTSIMVGALFSAATIAVFWARLEASLS
jgi:hypothetical protein